MRCIIFVLILFSAPSFSSGYCVDLDGFKVDKVEEQPWFDISISELNGKYSIVFKVPKIKENEQFEWASFAFAQDNWEDMNLYVPLATGEQENTRVGTFFFDKHLLDKVWLILSYSSCESEYIFKLSDVVNTVGIER